MTLRQLQDEHREWSHDNFGNYEPWRPLLGAMEELGELAHAHLKLVDGIRGTAEFHQAAAADAVGDIVLFLAGYCTASGLDFQQVVEMTWAHVKTRDWKKDPLHGMTATEHKAAEPTK